MEGRREGMREEKRDGNREGGGESGMRGGRDVRGEEGCVVKRGRVVNVSSVGQLHLKGQWPIMPPHMGITRLFHSFFIGLFFFLSEAQLTLSASQLPLRSAWLLLTFKAFKDTFAPCPSAF